MKVAVFGVAGWLGRAVLENFAGKHEVRAFELNPEAWDVYRHLDGGWDGEKGYGDIADFHAIDKALEGMDGAVHLTASFGGIGFVCRHDLAQACHLALETDAIDFDIMHTTSHPKADQYCNVACLREILGLEYKGLPPTEG